jgi:hypothetical protein
MDRLPRHLQRDLVVRYLTTPERALLRWRGRVARAWWCDPDLRPALVWRLRRVWRAWRAWHRGTVAARRPRRRRASWRRSGTGRGGGGDPDDRAILLR